MNTMTANIQREWLARIIDRSKTIEYRDASDYWFNRLDRVGPPPFHLRLINGMRPDLPEATVLVDKVETDLLLGVLRFSITEVVSTLRWDAKWHEKYPPLPADLPFDPNTLLDQKLPSTSVVIEVSPSLFAALRAPGEHQFNFPLDEKLVAQLSGQGPDPVLLKLSTSFTSVEALAYEISIPSFGGPFSFS